MSTKTITSLLERLEEINHLVKVVKIQDAESQLRELLGDLTSDEKIKYNDPLQATLDRFQKKRRVALREILEQGLPPTVDLSASKSLSTFSSPTKEPPSLGAFRARLRATLSDLSEYHIFQWSSHYRDSLRPLLSESLDFTDAEARRGALAAIKKDLSAHAVEIFTKGHNYLSQTNPSANSVVKSLTGLQSFIELFVEFYSADARADESYRIRTILRRTYSAALCAVLVGYSKVRIGELTGGQILPRYPRSWAHYIGFLTSEDLNDLAKDIEPGEFRTAITDTLSVVVSALDTVVDSTDDYLSALPRMGEFNWNERRLEISLQQTVSGADPRPIVLRCYTDSSQITQPQLEEASHRDLALLVARLRPSVYEIVESKEKLRSITVNPLSSDVSSSVSRAVAILYRALQERNTALSPTAPLNYNYASDFPLHNPFILRYFHVYRTSIRKLLGNFERRNGVRLWCSVRRSGKTTACFDLGLTTGHSMVVSQTCDETLGKADSDLFYRLVLDAMDAGRQISPQFFVEAVEKCTTSRRASNSRYVFVLDEYETLFERMNIRLRRDKEVRYAVVQPLLNQMVSFSKENLLVFVGQRPDAHYIMMDQNQLSAYVQQDSFPLFEHGSDNSEFEDLIRKIVTERIPFDSSFSGAVHAETSGHPFLTVKVMIDFFDWLIENGRPLRGIVLSGEDFVAFSARRLQAGSIATNGGYDFFRNAIIEAMSEDGREHTPWLHAVYAVMQRVSMVSRKALRITRGEYYELMKKSDESQSSNYSPDELLRTGAQANFFDFNDDSVWIKIPILGKISLAARRGVQW